MATEEGAVVSLETADVAALSLERSELKRGPARRVEFVSETPFPLMLLLLDSQGREQHLLTMREAETALVSDLGAAWRARDLSTGRLCQLRLPDGSPATTLRVHDQLPKPIRVSITVQHLLEPFPIELAVFESATSSLGRRMVARVSATGSAGDAPVVLLLLVDVSTGMGTARLRVVREALEALISSLTRSTSVAIIAYSAHPAVALQLRPMTPANKRQAKTVLGQLAAHPSSPAHIAPAVRLSAQLFARAGDQVDPSAAVHGVLVSGGRVSEDETAVRRVLGEFQARAGLRVPMHVIGMSGNLTSHDGRILQLLCSLSGGRFALAVDPGAVSQQLGALLFPLRKPVGTSVELSVESYGGGSVDFDPTPYRSERPQGCITVFLDAMAEGDSNELGGLVTFPTVFQGPDQGEAFRAFSKAKGGGDASSKDSERVSLPQFLVSLSFVGRDGVRYFTSRVISPDTVNRNASARALKSAAPVRAASAGAQMRSVQRELERRHQAAEVGLSRRAASFEEEQAQRDGEALAASRHSERRRGRRMALLDDAVARRVRAEDDCLLKLRERTVGASKRRADRKAVADVEQSRWADETAAWRQTAQREEGELQRSRPQLVPRHAASGLASSELLDALTTLTERAQEWGEAALQASARAEYALRTVPSGAAPAANANAANANANTANARDLPKSSGYSLYSEGTTMSGASPRAAQCRVDPDIRRLIEHTQKTATVWRELVAELDSFQEHRRILEALRLQTLEEGAERAKALDAFWERSTLWHAKTLTRDREEREHHDRCVRWASETVADCANALLAALLEKRGAMRAAHAAEVNKVVWARQWQLQKAVETCTDVQERAAADLAEARRQLAAAKAAGSAAEQSQWASQAGHWAGTLLNVQLAVAITLDQYAEAASALQEAQSRSADIRAQLDEAQAAADRARGEADASRTTISRMQELGDDGMLLGRTKDRTYAVREAEKQAKRAVERLTTDLLLAERAADVGDVVVRARFDLLMEQSRTLQRATAAAAKARSDQVDWVEAQWRVAKASVTRSKRASAHHAVRFSQLQSLDQITQADSQLWLDLQLTDSSADLAARARQSLRRVAALREELALAQDRLAQALEVLTERRVSANVAVVAGGPPASLPDAALAADVDAAHNESVVLSAQVAAAYAKIAFCTAEHHGLVAELADRRAECRYAAEQCALLMASSADEVNQSTAKLQTNAVDVAAAARALVDLQKDVAVAKSSVANLQGDLEATDELIRQSQRVLGVVSDMNDPQTRMSKEQHLEQTERRAEDVQRAYLRASRSAAAREQELADAETRLVQAQATQDTLWANAALRAALWCEQVSVIEGFSRGMLRLQNECAPQQLQQQTPAATPEDLPPAREAHEAATLEARRRQYELEWAENRLLRERDDELRASDRLKWAEAGSQSADQLKRLVELLIQVRGSHTSVLKGARGCAKEAKNTRIDALQELLHVRRQVSLTERDIGLRRQRHVAATLALESATERKHAALQQFDPSSSSSSSPPSLSGSGSGSGSGGDAAADLAPDDQDDDQAGEADRKARRDAATQIASYNSEAYQRREAECQQHTALITAQRERLLVARAKVLEAEARAAEVTHHEAEARVWAAALQTKASQSDEVVHWRLRGKVGVLAQSRPQAIFVEHIREAVCRELRIGSNNIRIGSDDVRVWPLEQEVEVRVTVLLERLPGALSPAGLTQQLLRLPLPKLFGDYVDELVRAPWTRSAEAAENAQSLAAERCRCVEATRTATVDADREAEALVGLEAHMGGLVAALAVQTLRRVEQCLRFDLCDGDTQGGELPALHPDRLAREAARVVSLETREAAAHSGLVQRMQALMESMERGVRQLRVTHGAALRSDAPMDGGDEQLRDNVRALVAAMDAEAATFFDLVWVTAPAREHEEPPLSSLHKPTDPLRELSIAAYVALFVVRCMPSIHRVRERRRKRRLEESSRALAVYDMRITCIRALERAIGVADQGDRREAMRVIDGMLYRLWRDAAAGLPLAATLTMHMRGVLGNIRSWQSNGRLLAVLLLATLTGERCVDPRLPGDLYFTPLQRRGLLHLNAVVSRRHRQPPMGAEPVITSSTMTGFHARWEGDSPSYRLDVLELLVSGAGEEGWMEVYRGSRAEHTVTGLRAGATYLVRVAHISAEGVAGQPSLVSIALTLRPPPVASRQGQFVILSWESHSDGVQGTSLLWDGGDSPPPANDGEIAVGSVDWEEVEYRPHSGTTRVMHHKHKLAVASLPAGRVLRFCVCPVREGDSRIRGTPSAVCVVVVEPVIEVTHSERTSPTQLHLQWEGFSRSDVSYEVRLAESDSKGTWSLVWKGGDTECVVDGPLLRPRTFYWCFVELVTSFVNTDCKTVVRRARSLPIVRCTAPAAPTLRGYGSRLYLAHPPEPPQGMTLVVQRDPEDDVRVDHVYRVRCTFAGTLAAQAQLLPPPAPVLVPPPLPRKPLVKSVKVALDDDDDDGEDQHAIASSIRIECDRLLVPFCRAIASEVVGAASAGTRVALNNRDSERTRRVAMQAATMSEAALFRAVASVRLIRDGLSTVTLPGMRQRASKALERYRRKQARRELANAVAVQNMKAALASMSGPKAKSGPEGAEEATKEAEAGEGAGAPPAPRVLQRFALAEGPLPVSPWSCFDSAVSMPEVVDKTATSATLSWPYPIAAHNMQAHEAPLFVVEIWDPESGALVRRPGVEGDVLPVSSTPGWLCVYSGDATTCTIHGLRPNRLIRARLGVRPRGRRMPPLLREDAESAHLGLPAHPTAREDAAAEDHDDQSTDYSSSIYWLTASPTPQVEMVQMDHDAGLLRVALPPLQVAAEENEVTPVYSLVATLDTQPQTAEQLLQGALASDSGTSTQLTVPTEALPCNRVVSVFVTTTLQEPQLVAPLAFPSLHVRIAPPRWRAATSTTLLLALGGPIHALAFTEDASEAPLHEPNFDVKFSVEIEAELGWQEAYAGDCQYHTLTDLHPHRVYSIRLRMSVQPAPGASTLRQRAQADADELFGQWLVSDARLFLTAPDPPQCSWVGPTGLRLEWPGARVHHNPRAQPDQLWYALERGSDDDGGGFVQEFVGQRAACHVHHLEPNTFHSFRLRAWLDSWDPRKPGGDVVSTTVRWLTQPPPPVAVKSAPGVLSLRWTRPKQQGAAQGVRFGVQLKRCSPQYGDWPDVPSLHGPVHRHPELYDLVYMGHDTHCSIPRVTGDHHYRLRLVVDFGHGVCFSETARVRTAPTPPDAPAALRVELHRFASVTNRDQCVAQLRWAEPPANGAPVLGYRVEKRILDLSSAPAAAPAAVGASSSSPSPSPSPSSSDSDSDSDSSDRRGRRGRPEAREEEEEAEWVQVATSRETHVAVPVVVDLPPQQRTQLRVCAINDAGVGCFGEPLLVPRSCVPAELPAFSASPRPKSPSLSLGREKPRPRSAMARLRRLPESPIAGVTPEASVSLAPATQLPRRLDADLAALVPPALSPIASRTVAYDPDKDLGKSPLKAWMRHVATDGKAPSPQSPGGADRRRTGRNTRLTQRAKPPPEMGEMRTLKALVDGLSEGAGDLQRRLTSAVSSEEEASALASASGEDIVIPASKLRARGGTVISRLR